MDVAYSRRCRISIGAHAGSSWFIGRRWVRCFPGAEASCFLLKPDYRQDDDIVRDYGVPNTPYIVIRVLYWISCSIKL